jgi:DUSAM domain-containing protein
MTDESEIDWSPIRALARRVVEEGEALELGDDTRALLRSGAREVAIHSEDTEDALRSVSAATALLREIQRRMDDGNDRLSEAHLRAQRLRDAGDFPGARKALEDALAVEVVPLYREQLEIQIEKLATLESVFLTGHIAPGFHAWSQVRALALRVQQGRPLELRDDLRAFLRQTAPSVAITEAEADKALESLEGATALLGRMMERILVGEHRIKRALSRMMDCREAGDRKGALQALRDVLAVEVVPLFRQMAQENLDRYDEPPPDW